ncbi:MAG: hypothetical protein AB7F43_00795 [Bacteriovoracia bacterium]
MFSRGTLILLTIVLSSAQLYAADVTVGQITKKATQGKRPFSDIFPDINYEDVAEVQVKCHESGPEKFDTRNCNDTAGKPGFKTMVIEQTKSRSKKVIEDYYAGKIVTNWISGDESKVPVPVCNFNDGEFEKNKLDEGCGSQCKFRVKIGLTGSSISASGCNREDAIARGAFVQLEKYFTDKVISEFKDGKLKLVDFDGRKPCAPQAAETIQMQAGHETVEKELTAWAGEKRAAEAKCEQKEDHQVTSLGPCRMQMSQNYLVSQWAGLLACEIHARSTKEMYQSWNSVVKSVSSCISSSCSSIKCSVDEESECGEKITNCYRSRFSGCLEPAVARFKTDISLEPDNATKVESVTQTVQVTKGNSK